MARTIEATCTQCAQDDRISVDPAIHDRYLMREGLVQNLFPALTREQREILISANPPYEHGFSYYVCGTCWPTLMGEEDE